MGQGAGVDSAVGSKPLVKVFAEGSNVKTGIIRKAACTGPLVELELATEDGAEGNEFIKIRNKFKSTQEGKACQSIGGDVGAETEGDSER